MPLSAEQRCHVQTPSLQLFGLEQQLCLLQMTVAEFGDILPPITADGPKNVTGELDLTQSLAGVKADATADTRGLKPSPLGAPNFANLSHVTVAAPGRVSPGVKTHVDHAEL